MSDGKKKSALPGSNIVGNPLFFQTSQHLRTGMTIGILNAAANETEGGL
jgi:hypothetical protein